VGSFTVSGNDSIAMTDHTQYARQRNRLLR